MKIHYLEQSGSIVKEIEVEVDCATIVDPEEIKEIIQYIKDQVKITEKDIDNYNSQFTVGIPEANKHDSQQDGDDYDSSEAWKNN